MPIARTLEDYLRSQGVEYEVVAHPHSTHSSETAQVGHIPGKRLAKAVMLEHDDGYLMAVIPSNRHVALRLLHRELERQIGLATETELGTLFPDCELGAIPPIGSAYGVEVVVEEELTQEPEVWFEAGDHQELVHLSGEHFQRLMSGVRRARISQAP